MGIYHKNTSNITKIADIYLKQTSAITRICKVYICTAANTFELVYDGCGLACNCETFCDTFCASRSCWCPCMYISSAPSGYWTTNVGHNNPTINEDGIDLTFRCGCNSVIPAENWVDPANPTSSECTSTICGDTTCSYPGCFYNNIYEPCFNLSWTPPGGGGPPTCNPCPPGNGITCETCTDGDIDRYYEDTLGDLGESVRVYYICRKSCCPTPNNGYTACRDNAGGNLTNGDACCNYIYYDDLKGIECTSGNDPCECDSSLTCA